MTVLMRYLRMLTNALAGGVLSSTYLFVLVLQLNPSLPVISMAAVDWAGAVMAFYVPAITAAFYFLMLGREVFASRPLRPAWISVKLLAWIAAVASSVASAITWANLHVFESLLSGAAAVRMQEGAIALTAGAAVLVAIAFLRYPLGAQGSRLTAGLLGAAMTMSVLVPLWLRGPGETQVHPPDRRSSTRVMPVPSRIHVIALDGASLGFIRQRVAAHQLPHFARLLDRGAVLDLATVQPTEVSAVWTAASTGKRPQQTGIRSDVVFRINDTDADGVDLLPDYCFAYALVSQGFIRPARHLSTAVQARPLWHILADYGIGSGIVNWPLTYPAQASLGYVVSDRFDEAASSPLRLADARAGDPTTAVDVAREIFDRWQARPWHEVLTTFTLGEVEPVEVHWARWDRAYADTAAALDQQFAPRLTAIRFEGLEAFGHAYLRQAQPELFGETRRLAPERSVLDRYYSHIDAEVGRAARQLAPGDLLLVISGFGMDPTPTSKRLLARLLDQNDLTGTHEAGPDGFLLAYGTNVATGQFARGSVFDVAPTVLYYLGVPVGRDMDGYVRTDLFTSSYTVEHPVKYVAAN
jgi:hypothetical protein